MEHILFTKTLLDIPEKYFPFPTSKAVPDWYKKTQSYMSEDKRPNGNGSSSSTIKKCMPVFDAMTAGYIIPSYVDVYVSQKDGAPWYEWPTLAPIEFHPNEQAPLYPKSNSFPFPKWINLWGIKTPPGYSCLFVNPMHAENRPFSILEGIVDTDTYTAPVNFPFVMTTWPFEGLITAGTPIVQVIPFKREAWEMGIGTEEDLRTQNKVTLLLKSKFWDSYKYNFRQVKEYK